MIDIEALACSVRNRKISQHRNCRDCALSLEAFDLCSDAQTGKCSRLCAVSPFAHIHESVITCAQFHVGKESITQQGIAECQCSISTVTIILESLFQLHDMVSHNARACRSARTIGGKLRLILSLSKQTR